MVADRVLHERSVTPRGGRRECLPAAAQSGYGIVFAMLAIFAAQYGSLA